MTNIITACFGGTRYANTRPAWLIDHGMVLKLSGVELPEVYAVDFSNSKTSAAKRVLGNADGVVIPDEYFLSKAQQIYAWVYLTTGDSGYTVLQVTIPLTQRPEVTDEPPTPQETDLIEQAIAALNDGVARSETAADNAEQSADNAADAEANAAESERLAKLSEDNAAESEDNAKESETNAAASERNAAQSEQNAAESARRAKANADAADESRQGAQTAAEDAESAAREAETAAENAERIERELPDTIADALREAKESGEFDGEDGKDGANGVTYTPTVDAEGVISWVNDGGLPNPQPRNIKGLAGNDGEDGKDGATPNLTIGTVETLEPGADATAEITGTPENPVLNLGIPQGEQGEGADTSNLAPVIVNSASGAIASFADGAEDMPIKQLTVNVEPVQDLHGYDSPWPAGGGKNILPPVGNSTTFQSITISYDEESETYTINGTLTSPGNIPLASIEPNAINWVNGDRYTISCDVVSGSFTLGGDSGITYALSMFNSNASAYIRGDTTLTESALDGYRGTGNAFESSGNYQLMLQCWRVGTVFNNLKIKVQIEAGTTPTAWSPYSNICPIDGWYSVSVTRTGANLLDSLFADGKVPSVSSGALVNANNACRSDYITVNSGSVTFSCKNTSARAIYCFLYDGNKNFLLYAYATGTRNFVTATHADAKYAMIRCDGGTTAPDESMLELGSTASAYEHYAGNTYAITLGDTVYGGTLDVPGGKMVVDRLEYKLLWSSGISPTVGTTCTAKYLNVYGEDIFLKSGNTQGKTISDIIPYQYNNNDTPHFYLAGYDVNARRQSVRVFLPNDTDPDTEIQFVLGLATPLEITLTPTQIETLLGTNNIWADAGNVDVDYRADTKLYIDNIHQPTEDDMTADAQIASGKYFLIGNNLYLSTTVIPAGDTIIPGTNCIKTNLAEALNALNA